MIREPLPRIPLDACVRGRVYQIQCRNLAYGVFDGETGFIGIRTKFGDRYLFTELHWDADSTYGTVSGMRDIGIDVPPEITVADLLGTKDATTGRPLAHDPTIDNPNESVKGAKGWWKFADTGEPAPAVPACSAVAVRNATLFQFLDEIEGRKP